MCRRDVITVCCLEARSKRGRRFPPRGRARGPLRYMTVAPLFQTVDDGSWSLYLVSEYEYPTPSVGNPSTPFVVVRDVWKAFATKAGFDKRQSQAAMQFAAFVKAEYEEAGPQVRIMMFTDNSIWFVTCSIMFHEMVYTGDQKLTPTSFFFKDGFPFCTWLCGWFVSSFRFSQQDQSSDKAFLGEDACRNYFFYGFELSFLSNNRPVTKGVVVCEKSCRNCCIHVHRQYVVSPEVLFFPLCSFRRRDTFSVHRKR